MPLTNIDTTAKKLLNSDVPGGVFGSEGRGMDTGDRIHAAIASLNTANTTITSQGVTIADHTTKLTNQANRLVKVALTVVGGSGGATAGTMSGVVTDLATGAALTSAVTLMIVANSTSTNRYRGTIALSSTITFGVVATGTERSKGNGYIILTTDATGAFNVPPSNSAAEDAFFSAVSAPGGVTTAGQGCVVVECVSVSATWAA